MGALDDFLVGKNGVQPEDMSQPKTSGITDDLLDRLRIVEGGKEKFPINKQTKAMGPYQFMPDTVQMLHKQGYEFNPFNEEQARGAAKHYLEQLVKQNKGDVNKAVAQYGGHITADPTKYVNAVVGKQTETKPAQSTSALDDFLNQSQELGPPVKVESSGGVKAKSIPQMPPTQTPQEPTGVRTRGGVPVKDTSDVFTGAMGGLARTIGGAARGAVTSALGAPGDINKLIVENIGSAFPNAPAAPTTEQIQQALPGQPTTQEGKVAQQLGAFLPVPLIPKVPGAKAAIEAQFAEKVAPAVRIEPTMEAGVKPAVAKVQPAANQPIMAGVGAAKTADASTLAEAVARATPELKAELSKVKPGDLNVDALNRIMEADQLPVPLRYTEGQATQDPKILSDEINILGSEKKYADRLNEQNAVLHENVDLMRDRVAPNINTTDYVHDAENVIERVNNFIKTDNDAITKAYKDLEEYGAGKIQVDSKTFAENANKVLAEGDDAEFLPSVISKKLEDYGNGKAMNFNQFENLRSQIAKEIRKAQKADDGNAVHALALVRSQLEQMPLLNETAEAKVLADKARSLAKSQFDLLDKNRDTYNPLYEKVFNGGADTKDLIQSLVLRGKNADFNKVLELAKNDPTTLEHLRSGALNSIVRDSTTQDGKFKATVFAKKIRDLDLNKRLEPLFGEEAKTLRAIANAGVNVNARPAGSFVNESKSGVVGVQMAKQFIAEQAKSIPGYGMIVQPAAKVLGERKISKQVEKALKPGAGVKLSDIGKKK